jgi:hypothetical protein
MSARIRVFQAVPFDGATSDAKEPLIATDDAEKEDQGLEEQRDLCSLKLSSLLLGLIVGFFILFAAKGDLPIHLVMKSNTGVIVFSILWSLFTAVAPLVLIFEFIRNLVTVTHSAVGGSGSSEELLEDMILQLQYQFGVGVSAGICLTFAIMDPILGTRVHAVGFTFAIMVFAFIWYKVLMASATDSKPSSSRRSTAEQTMMTV